MTLLLLARVALAAEPLPVVFAHPDEVVLAEQPVPDWLPETPRSGTACRAVVIADASGAPVDVEIGGCGATFAAATDAALRQSRWHPPLAARTAIGVRVEWRRFGDRGEVRATETHLLGPAYEGGSGCGCVVLVEVEPGGAVRPHRPVR